MKDKIRMTDSLLKIQNYSDMLYKIALTQMKNRHDAEDIVQEVMYQYIKSSKNFENEEYEKAWLIHVTLNACRKVWRSAWYKHSIPFLSVIEKGTESGLEENIIYQEEGREIIAAVLKLPRKYREVIHLFYFQELSINEIAGITGRKVNTITSQMTRGRELLRKTLKEDYHFE